MNRLAFVSATPSSSFLSKRSNFSTCSVTSRPSTARRPARQAPSMKVYDVEIQLYGETHTIPIDEELTLLEGIEEYGLEVLYSCRAGVCVTCAAKILSGTVDLGAASITDDLKEDGYVLTCSGYPKSEGIRLEMNHFDDAYNKQYGQYEKDQEK